MNKIFYLILIFLLVSSCQREDAYIKDLNFIYNQIKTNHPGVYNQEDPDFAKNLENSYQQASKIIFKTSKPEKKKQALSEFIKSFNDVNLHILWSDQIEIVRHKKSKITIFNKEFADKVTWLNLNSFDLNLEEEKIIYEFLPQLPFLGSNKAIIIDLRGNDDEDLGIGKNIIDGLFSLSYANEQRARGYKDMMVDWRVSFDNLTHVWLLYRSTALAIYNEAMIGIKNSLALDEIYFRQKPYKINTSQAKVTTPLRVEAKIIVIIDKNNKGGALEFIDQLKMMTNTVVLIGEATSADRLYKEIRNINLPSGIGTLYFPINVLRNKPRGDNISYKPDYKVDISNNEILENFIRKEILSR